MTISTQASQSTFLGNGVTTSFVFNFVADSSADIEVIYTNASDVQTILNPSLYTLVINPAATGQIWGVGGTVTYPLSGSPIANGTFLTISRLLPYTQTITIANQGDFAAQVIEEMGDTLEMQIQQLAARTTQFRGVWITATAYTVGDIVQDGANGNNTKNYYICQVANTSGTWSTDLGAGDWAISVLAVVPAGTNVITLTGDVTGSSATPIATTLATVNSNVGQFSGLTVNAKGLITAATTLTGDITSSGAATTLATVNSNVGAFTSANITVNAKGLITAAANGSAGKLATYQVTDTTDITVSQVATQTNVGSVVPITIPTKGFFEISFSGEIIFATGNGYLVLGIRIGSTNYFPVVVEGATTYYEVAYETQNGATTDVSSSMGSRAGAFGSGPSSLGAYKVILPIQENSIPTGAQSVQVIVAKLLTNGATIKGTVVTTRVYISVFDFS